LKKRVILEDADGQSQSDQMLSGYDVWDQERELCVTLEAKVTNFGVQKHGGSK
jgi:hypothetical protein